MTGLVGLVLIVIWLAICAVLTIKIPQWLGAKRRTWLWSLMLFPVLVVAPIVDELVGMRQFEQLCKERAVAWISPDMDKVKRAERTFSKVVDIPNFWIRITSYQSIYTDIDSGKKIISVEHFSTKGGRIAGIALLGGTHACARKYEIQLVEQLQRVHINALLEQGEKL